MYFSLSRSVCLTIVFLLSPVPLIVGQEVDNQAPAETLDAAAPEEGSGESPAVEPEEEVKPAEPQVQAISEALAQDTVVEVSKPEVLQFNFSGTRWLDVLDWFASQADLALQVDQPPIGTFSFSDPSKTYTIAEGLDVINLALMKRGYSLVRRGRMLQVIDLEVENADKLISEIAELVTPDSLDERGRSDIVSCVFPLGSMTPDAAKTELAL
ncbi:MAG: hypothetical protein VYB72_00595, partial [Planctomycetota bacterium]|nr:hypothetical protein [Planctomycetota bacterium]